jgi:hypothetical protein
LDLGKETAGSSFPPALTLAVVSLAAFRLSKKLNSVNMQLPGNLEVGSSDEPV